MFRRGDRLYRQINTVYRENYDLFISSGLHQQLVESRLLIPHREVDVEPAIPELAYRTIEPERVEFISYPYEWSFSQFKDAALMTLDIQHRALDAGMSLKDCSAYNVQFHRGRPIFIDTLSFEKYREGEPWVAYRQFCRHFLAPLALMSSTDVRMSQLLWSNIDGIPLDLTSKLLPWRSRLQFSLLLHIHLHARTEAKYADGRQAANLKGRRVTKLAVQGLLDSLRSAVRKLQWQPAGTQWGDYYSDTNYSETAADAKAELIGQFLDEIRPASVWDLGANTGRYSRIAAQRDLFTVSLDLDPAAVEKNYRLCREKNETNVLPLVMDLTDPSPGLGWHNRERDSFVQRCTADAIMALALIHHLAISNNLPFHRIASSLAEICRWLIIEFVPKSDSQVQRLLAAREDIFDGYTRENFEAAFGEHFELVRSEPIAQSQRVLYLMRGDKS